MPYQCSQHGTFTKDEADVVSGQSVTGKRTVVQYHCPRCGEDMAYKADN